jgi:predicted short-subunit dehydrogenase-like oxidoreductase (DUF2520 family)
VLKLARGVEDALTGIVWRDDAQIVVEHLEKRYGSPARCEVRVKYLGVYACELDAAIAAESFRQEHMPFAAPDAELLAALAQPEPLAVAA